MMYPQEIKQFELFKKEVMKYDYLDGFLAESILNRFIQPLNKRRFFNENLKRKYYHFWFRILGQSGRIKPMGMGYKIIKEEN